MLFDERDFNIRKSGFFEDWRPFEFAVHKAISIAAVRQH